MNGLPGAKHCHPDFCINNRRHAEEKKTTFFSVTVPAESSSKDGTATLGNNYCNMRSLPLVLRQCHSSHPEPFSLACRMRSDPGRPARDARLSPRCCAMPSEPQAA